MTYEQQVKRIADRLAKAEWEKHEQYVAWENLPTATMKKDHLVERMIPLAKICLEEMADSYTKGSKRGFTSGSNAAMGVKNKTTCEQDMQTDGLIPNHSNNKKDGE